MTAEYAWLFIFGIIAYMIIIDPNVGSFIILMTKILKVNIERMIWMIRFHPVILSSPVSKWLMMRKYMKTAKELSQELSKDDSDGV